MLISHFADQQDTWELLQPGLCPERPTSIALFGKVGKDKHTSKSSTGKTPVGNPKPLAEKRFWCLLMSSEEGEISLLPVAFLSLFIFIFIIYSYHCLHRGRGSVEIQFILTNCRCTPPVHLMCISCASCANVHRCLLTWKKLLSIVPSFRSWPLQEKTKYRKR